MISFSFDAKTKSVSVDSVFDKELNINDDEKKLAQIVLSFITPPQKFLKASNSNAVVKIIFP